MYNVFFPWRRALRRGAAVAAAGNVCGVGAGGGGGGSALVASGGSVGEGDGVRWEKLSPSSRGMQICRCPFPNFRQN